jgi:hypothetical protein
MSGGAPEVEKPVLARFVSRIGEGEIWIFVKAGSNEGVGVGLQSINKVIVELSMLGKPLADFYVWIFHGQEGNLGRRDPLSL